MFKLSLYNEDNVSQSEFVFQFTYRRWDMYGEFLIISVLEKERVIVMSWIKSDICLT